MQKSKIGGKSFYNANFLTCLVFIYCSDIWIISTFTTYFFKVLKTTGWAETTWVDNRLTWDPEDFGGIDRISVKHNEVLYWWQTQILFYL